MNIWNRLFQKVVSFALCIVLVAGLVGCGAPSSQVRRDRPSSGTSVSNPETPPSLGANLQEVSPAIALDDLKAWLDRYQPQVTILSPRPNQTLGSTDLTVELVVANFEVFQDQKTGLGPHLHLILDNQASQEIYDLKTPIRFENLTPGTHTLRAFALYPWDESFKNAGAFAQVTFNVLTSSDENNPADTLPLITYNQPQGTYGSEPVLLDFYLSHAPLQTTLDPQQSNIGRAWQIRVTVNGTSFNLDRWQSIYLRGLQPGTNWVRLELLDGQGRPIDNVFNTVTRVVDYQPEGNDTRSRLFRGELTAKNVQSFLSRNLPAQLPPPVTKPTPAVAPEPSPSDSVPLEPLEQENIQSREESETVLGEPEPIPANKPAVTSETVEPETPSAPSPQGQQRFLPFFNPKTTPTPTAPEPAPEDLSLEIEDNTIPELNESRESEQHDSDQSEPVSTQATPQPSQRPWQKQFSRFWSDLQGTPAPKVPPETPLETLTEISPEISPREEVAPEEDSLAETVAPNLPEPKTSEPKTYGGIPSRYFKSQSAPEPSPAPDELEPELVGVEP